MNVLLLALLLAAAAAVVLMLKRGSLPGGAVSLRTLTGAVTGLNTYTSTTVTGSGTGGPGGPASVSVSSESTTHREFFLRDGDGVETPIHIWGFDVPVANDQIVSLILAERKQRQRYAMFISHNARRSWPLYSSPAEVLVQIGAALPTRIMLFIAILSGLLVTHVGTASDGPAYTAGVVAAGALLATMALLRSFRGRALAARLRLCADEVQRTPPRNSQL